MTRRGNKQTTGFMVPDKIAAEVWAVTDYCDCDAEGTNVVALFDSKQTAEQFASARSYASTPWSMHVYHAMKRLD